MYYCSYSLFPVVVPASSKYLNDVAIAAIVIALISLLTSVVTVAIMVCFVVFFLKRSARITEGRNQSIDMQQNVAYATTAANTSEQQNTTYDTVA